MLLNCWVPPYEQAKAGPTLLMPPGVGLAWNSPGLLTAHRIAVMVDDELRRTFSKDQRT